MRKTRFQLSSMSSTKVPSTSFPRSSMKKHWFSFRRRRLCSTRSKPTRSHATSSCYCRRFIIWLCVTRNWAFLKSAQSAWKLALITWKAIICRPTLIIQSSHPCDWRCWSTNAKRTCKSAPFSVRSTSITTLYIIPTTPSRSLTTFSTSARSSASST